MLVHVAAPVRERQHQELEHREHDRRIRQRLHPPARVREQRVADASERQDRKRRANEQEFDKLADVARTVVAPSAIDDVGRKALHVDVLTPAAAPNDRGGYYV